MKAGHYRQFFFIVLLSGFAVRLVWALLVPVQPLSDSAAYDELAWNLVSKGSYSWNDGTLTAYWPVGTAYLYSLPYRIFGHHYAAPVAMNLIAATSALALIMIIARKWFSSSVALAAGGFYALWPSQIQFSSILASEIFFQLAVLLAIWASFELWLRSWIVRGAVTGLFLAVASYIRPLAMPLIAVLPAALIYSGHTNRKNLVAFTAASAAVMALCIAPWTLRNEHELGAPVVISTNGPPVTWMGNNPDATGTYIPLPDDVEGMSEVERSRVLGSRARSFIIGHPAQFALLFLRKLAVTHERETIGVVWNEQGLRSLVGPGGVTAMKILSTAYWLAILLLAVGGAVVIIVSERWRGLIHPALVIWVYFATLHAVTLAADRYHFPSIPYIAMLAGLATVTLLKRLRKLSDVGILEIRGHTTTG